MSNDICYVCGNQKPPKEQVEKNKQLMSRFCTHCWAYIGELMFQDRLGIYNEK